MWDRAGLWRDLYRRITELGVAVGVCPPKTRAKFGCGNGNAAKKEVRAGIQALWPDVRIRNDDVADGLVLGTMAAQLEGFEGIPVRGWHAEGLTKVALELAA
ncbi:hypothetical protein CH253_08300 [Rhodococcus sp. 06-156-3C]|nr:hypothetical protein CH253_08300 [Rhodococcus sp. 06-156-3C]